MSLRINVEQAHAQVLEISMTIMDLNTQIVALNQLKQEIKHSWKGEAAQAFERQVDALLRDVKRTKQKMDSLVMTIERTIAQIELEDKIMEEMLAVL